MKKYLLFVLTVLSSIGAFAQDSQEVGLDQKIDQAFQPVSTFFSKVIFFEIGGIPFVLILLVLSLSLIHI